ncbi:MAG: DUF1569 domain-containing protein [Chitinophagaceae bacterium]
MNAAKADFLKNKFVSLLRKIPADKIPAWGKMNLQQMVEHFSDSVKIASGVTVVKEIITPEGNLQKMHSFLMSGKPFKENTLNPLLSKEPPPAKHATIEDALTELQNEIDNFFSVFEHSDGSFTRNPFFGDLTFEMNVQLLHKHALHHLRQFGVSPVM